MASNLIEFLTRLSTDDDLVRAFKDDKVATMKANQVDDQHINLVVNKKYSEIQSLLGADYDIAKNSVIKAYKK
jgi:hypothetical protein